MCTFDMQNDTIQKIIRIAIATAFILLVPLVAMRFTGEVNWTLLDFVAGGAAPIGGTGPRRGKRSPWLPGRNEHVQAFVASLLRSGALGGRQGDRELGTQDHRFQ